MLFRLLNRFSCNSYRAMIFITRFSIYFSFFFIQNWSQRSVVVLSLATHDFSHGETHLADRLVFAMHKDSFHFLMQLESKLHQNGLGECWILCVCHHFCTTLLNPFKFILLSILIEVFEFFLIQNADWIDLSEILNIL